MRAAYLAAAAGVLAAAWWYMDDAEVIDTSELIEDAALAVDDITGGVMKLSSMAQVTAQQVANKNVQAFLRVIRRGEGTADQAGYSRLFGGEQFASFADHPRKLVKKGGYNSTAAGAYQFLSSTWDETARIMRLSRFGPAEQDMAAVGRIAARGALGDVLAGRFADAVKKCAKEWASLPFSPYGQPTISMETAQYVYASNGGVMA